MEADKKVGVLAGPGSRIHGPSPSLSASLMSPIARLLARSFPPAGGPALIPPCMSPCLLVPARLSSMPLQSDQRTVSPTATDLHSAPTSSSKVAAAHGFDYLLDQAVPLLARAVYGDKLPKLVAVLRNPTERLHSAYYGYDHYFNRHGRNASGRLVGWLVGWMVGWQDGDARVCGLGKLAECLVHTQVLTLP
jgi:hypothetical protein